MYEFLLTFQTRFKVARTLRTHSRQYLQAQEWTITTCIMKIIESVKHYQDAICKPQEDSENQSICSKFSRANVADKCLADDVQTKSGKSREYSRPTTTQSFFVSLLELLSFFSFIINFYISSQIFHFVWNQLLHLTRHFNGQKTLLQLLKHAHITVMKSTSHSNSAMSFIYIEHLYTYIYIYI